MNSRSSDVWQTPGLVTSMGEAMFRKKATAKPLEAMVEAFAPLGELELDDIALFEFFLLGAITETMDQHGDRQLVGEKLASDVIATMPVAALLARAASEKLRSQIKVWDASEIDGLAELRSIMSMTCKTVAKDPLTMMQHLVPVLQADLAECFAGTPRVRCAWVWMMSFFGSYILGGLSTDERWEVYANTVFRWERAAAEMRP